MAVCTSGRVNPSIYLTSGVTSLSVSAVYTFTGWNGDIVSEMPDRDITYVATWSINQYTISFNTDGGSDIAPVTQDYNTEVTVNEIPVKNGYTFIGWDNDIPEYMPAGNMVLTAKWSKDV